jgi:hypothetical protein
MPVVTHNTHSHSQHDVLLTLGTSSRSIRQIYELLVPADQHHLACALSIDADGTQSTAHLPQSLVPSNGHSATRAPALVRTPLPGRDVVTAILDGAVPALSDTPPDLLRLLEGNGMVGVGGKAFLGHVAISTHETPIRGTLGTLLTRLTDARVALRGEQAERPPCVFEVAGCLGGMFGGLDRLHDLVAEYTRLLGVDLTFQRLVLFPGVHPAKDMEGAQANAWVWLVESSARASGRYVQLHFDRAGDKPLRRRAPVLPTWIVSDVNNAPGMPATVTISALFTLTAHWLRLLTATPFGARLEAALVDFEDDARTVDPRGERRMARSFGLSFVTLNRERVARFTVQRLVRCALDSLQAPAHTEAVEAAMRQFIRAQRLREGADGFQEVSEALLGLGPTELGLDQRTRFRRLFETQRQSLEGLPLLRAIRDIFHTTVAQTRDAADHIQEARRELVARVIAAMERDLSRGLWDPALGVPSMQAWLHAGQRTCEHLAQLTIAERSRHSTQIEALQKLVQRQEEALAHFLAMPTLQRWFNRSHAQTLVDQYSRDATALAVAHLEDRARAEAITGLQELAQAFADRSVKVTRLLDELVSASTRASEEEARLREWDGTLVNPNGLTLDDDLDDLCRHVLTRPGEEGQDEATVEQRAARELLQTLAQRDALLTLAQEEGRLATELAAMAHERVRTPIGDLHVQTELLRRYPAGSPALQACLRARDHEAHERVTLQGTVELENPTHVLRFVCGDSHRAAEIVQALHQAAAPRAEGQAPYEFVDTGDPEQLVLVQLRLSVPPSQLGLAPLCRAAYEQRSRGQAQESLHSTLVGRFLPQPGVPATDLDAQVALLKAWAMGALEISEAGALVYRGFLGEREEVESDIDLFRQFAVRVEVSTRFYCDWQEYGPEPLRRRMALLGTVQEALQPDSAPAPQQQELAPEASPVGRHVAALLSPDAVTQVLAELEWYARNTVPQATWWGRRQR